MKALKIFTICVLVLGVAGYGFYKYKNQQPKPDYYEIYKKQDTVPKGKVGVFVTGLIMPEKLNTAFFQNVAVKIFNTIVPWPGRNFAFLDKGVALLDPVTYHSHDPFTPTSLIDPEGSDRDIDGIPYIEKYHQGQVKWVPPSKYLYLDHGYFLYTGRKGGRPTIVGKIINKSRVWYHNKGSLQHDLPHWKQTFDVIDATLAKIKEKYGAVESRAECNMLLYEMREKIFALLNAGCETLVVSSVLPMYSHFEEFNSGFRHTFDFVEEWEKEHPGKHIKVIMAPPMGLYQPYRQAFYEMVKDRLDTLPKDASVTVVLSVHGMPWDVFSYEAWIKLAPPWRDKIYEEIKALTDSYKFKKSNVVNAQDEFSDPIWDPKQKYLSTNRAYWNAINEGYDYAVNVPIEFTGENSDTMFHHALKNYHGFDQYDLYKPIDYPDWSVPLTREFVQGKTRIIYNGVPVGKYQKYVVEALYQSIDSILAQKK